MSETGVHVVARQEGPIPLDVEVRCAPGEVLALVGPSGSGKSTVLRTLAGLYRPRHARVTCNGQVWCDSEQGVFVKPHRRSVGMVFQHYALFPHMSALANVMAAMSHRPRGERQAAARALLDQVNLAGLEGRRPGDMSGGQRQRVAIARALARQPQVLLLDEPFSALDKVTRRKLYSEVAVVAEQVEMPIILVTHDFDEAARLADTMSLLQHGRILQTGEPHQVLSRPVSVEAARLVDLKNMLPGKIARHDGLTTCLSWNGIELRAPARPEFKVGEAVMWMIPSTQIILSVTDDGTEENRIEGTIGDIRELSEATVVSIDIDGPDKSFLTMTLPARYLQRNGLGVGSAVAITLQRQGLHLLAMR